MHPAVVFISMSRLFNPIGAAATAMKQSANRRVVSGCNDHTEYLLSSVVSVIISR